MRTHISSPLPRWAAWTGLGLLLAGLAACGGDDDPPATRTLQLAMTDAPACGYEHVYVTVNKIRVHQSAAADGSELLGWRELSIPTQRIDLLSLTNGVLQELGSLPLPAGTYQQMRLMLADNSSNPTPTNPLANALVMTGSTDEVPLITPSAQQSGFKLKTFLRCKTARWPIWCWTLKLAVPSCVRALPGATTSNPWWR